MSNRPCSLQPLFVFALVFCCNQSVQSQSTTNDWPQWLGPDRNGEWSEQGIVETIPDEGLDVAWRVPINGGYTSPSISGDRLVVMDWIKDEVTEDSKRQAGVIEGTERVLCLNTADGEQVWQHEYDSTYQVSYPGGPRCSPLIEDERVYTLGTMGQFICFNINTGEIIWQKNLAERYSAKPPVWGFASHPMIVGELIYCTVGGEGSGVVAMNKFTGAEVWKNLTAEEIGYAPPVLMQSSEGQQQLVVWYDVAIVGLDLNLSLIHI